MFGTRARLTAMERWYGRIREAAIQMGYMRLVALLVISTITTVKCILLYLSLEYAQLLQTMGEKSS
jgi:hypothetical protein